MCHFSIKMCVSEEVTTTQPFPSGVTDMMMVLGFIYAALKNRIEPASTQSENMPGGDGNITLS